MHFNTGGRGEDFFYVGRALPLLFAYDFDLAGELRKVVTPLLGQYLASRGEFRR